MPGLKGSKAVANRVSFQFGNLQVLDIAGCLVVADLEVCGLPNRIYFGERLESVIAEVRRGGPSAAVFYIDLDHFKDVNASEREMPYFARLS
jgi:Diguanylate cyclase, GGDEF domain